MSNHSKISSLSIRRFWGKGERWKRKRERAEGEKLPFSSPPPPSPISNLLSPSPLGRPDTQQAKKYQDMRAPYFTPASKKLIVLIFTAGLYHSQTDKTVNT